MTDVDDALARAHALVAQAADDLAGDDFGSLSAATHCREIVSLLEECGALPSAELLGASDPGDPRALLTRAAQVLDEIPAGDRPHRLTVVRVEIVAALDGLSGPG